ncbi:hypothetical protein C2G38_2218080 [Gigaspora rosea]|uniref:Uncharacterized protein n=1 Tax=Gigaspora rosea TaxID=44941 RepID=A0A397UAE2_9GLOM|nr:hypothetical protein C2G38_2218080 [Gigaspora rosea]
MSKISNYTNSTIVAKTSSNIFTYDIIQIGIYPNKNVLVYTAKPNQYRVPHNYIVKTTFGSKQSQKIITCSIQYQDKTPEFKIEFIYNNNTEIVISNKSASNAANLYILQYHELASIEIEQKTGQKPIPKKTKLNGVYVFELQLEQINKIRDQQSTTKRRKPFEDLGNSMQLKRSKYFGNQLLNLFEQQASQAFNNDDNVSLEGLIFSVGAQRFHINYEELNSKNIELQKQAVVKAMDIGGISRNTYRLLAAIGHDLPRE